MAIAKIRSGNRITIPVEDMDKKHLSEGDEVYFEIYGKVGRDVFLTPTIPSAPVVMQTGTINMLNSKGTGGNP